MKSILTAIIIFTFYPAVSQQLDIEGKVRITEMDTVKFDDHVVVRNIDGTLAEINLKVQIFRFFTDIPGGIQFLLTAGFRPIDLYNMGIPVDSLYGKKFQGGLIFYLDTLDEHDFEGLVAAPTDQHFQRNLNLEWGCHGTNIETPDVNSPSGSGADIGEGLNNTILIGESNCSPDSSAASVCLSLVLDNYDDWFLPSINELKEMSSNIGFGSTNIGGFVLDVYWSSSERDDLLAWFVDFTNGSQFFFNKFGAIRTRAARRF